MVRASPLRTFFFARSRCLVQYSEQHEEVAKVPGDYAVPSVGRAMKILELLAQSQRGLTLSDISRRLGFPKSSTHVLIKTLEATGYLKNSKLTGKFCFGLKLVSLSKMALENLDLREQARPFLRDLMLKSGLTVHLAILEGAEAVIIEKAEAPGMLRLATWVGRRLDANSSAVGKALLAFSSADICEHNLATRPMARNNRNTISSPVRLARELKKVREQGYSFEDEEGEIGFRCIGAPIFDSANIAVAAISIAGATSQIPNDRVTKLAALVKATAVHISERLGSGLDLPEKSGVPERIRMRKSGRQSV
jgi:DNA-binding IclR family transcriptional regulator